jgi:hypothetical protein
MAAPADAVSPPGLELGAPSIPMRPLAVGEVIDFSWDLVRRWPRISLTMGVSVAVAVQVVAVPLAALFALLLSQVDMQSATGALLLLFGFAATTYAVDALTNIGTAALSGLLASVTDDAVAGRTASFRRIRESMRGRWPSLIGVSAIVGVIETVAGLVLSIIGWAAVQPLVAMAGPATVLEKVSPFAAIRRATQLAGKDSGRVILIRGMAYLIQMLLSTAITFLVGGVAILLFSIVGPSTGLLFGLLFALEVAVLTTNALIAPFVAFNAGVLYADRRMRGEGLDIEVLLANRRRRRTRKTGA